MALVKRGKIYHYDFEFQGQPYRGTTHQTDKNKARLIEAKVKSDAAMIAMGLMPKPVIERPLFRDFILKRFLPHVRQNHSDKPGTLKFYTYTANRLLDFPSFNEKRLNEIDGALVEDYKQWRESSKKRRGTGTVKISLINSEVRVLRKAMLWAYDLDLIEKRPRIRIKAGERGRTLTLTMELERAYLGIAPEPLKSFVILLVDWGLRPTECLGLKKADITEDGVIVLDSKTPNGVRAIPHTQRTRDAVELLVALFPKSEWLFPNRTGGHLHYKSIQKRHRRLVRKYPDRFPDDFVLYSCRHTFGTKLAESGAHEFEIKGLMGHSSTAISQHYIHPSPSHLRVAMKRKEKFDEILRAEDPVGVLAGSPQNSEERENDPVKC